MNQAAAGAWEGRLKAVPDRCKRCNETFDHRYCADGLPAMWATDYAAMAALVETALGEQATRLRTHFQAAMDQGQANYVRASQLEAERDTESHFLMCDAHRSNKFFYSCVDCVNRAIATSRTNRTALRERLQEIEGKLLYAPPMTCADCLDPFYGPKCGCVPTCGHRRENYEAALALTRSPLSAPTSREEPKPGEPWKPGDPVDVDAHGNCSQCGGVHFGSGLRCVYRPSREETTG